MYTSSLNDQTGIIIFMFIITYFNRERKPKTQKERRQGVNTFRMIEKGGGKEVGGKIRILFAIDLAFYIWIIRLVP